MEGHLPADDHSLPRVDQGSSLKPEKNPTLSKLFQRVKGYKLNAIKRKLDHPELKVKWLFRDEKASPEVLKAVANNKAVVKKLKIVLSTPYAARRKGEQDRFLGKALPPAEAELKRALAAAKTAVHELHKADTRLRNASIKVEWIKFLGTTIAPPTDYQITQQLRSAMKNEVLKLERIKAAKTRMKLTKQYQLHNISEIKDLIDKDEPTKQKLFGKDDEP